MRHPCPNCNCSGNSEFPGQIVSFFEAVPTRPCGCGDGFVDDVDAATAVEESVVPAQAATSGEREVWAHIYSDGSGSVFETKAEAEDARNGHSSAVLELCLKTDFESGDKELWDSISDRLRQSHQAIADEGDPQVVSIKVNGTKPQAGLQILKATELSGTMSFEEMEVALSEVAEMDFSLGIPPLDKTKEWADYIITAEQKPPITTGLDGVDALIDGGWRPGINVALGFDNIQAVRTINSAGANSLTLTQSHIAKRNLLDGEYGKPAFGSGYQPTWDFDEVLGFIRDTTHQLVVLMGANNYMNTGNWKLDSVQANKLRDVVVESGKTLVMFESSDKVNQYVQRSADVVISRKSDATNHWYETTKNRHADNGSTKKEEEKPKKEEEKPVTCCATLEDFSGLVVGDVFSCRMNINPHDFGVAFEHRDNKGPGIYVCTGRRRTTEQKQAEFEAMYGKPPKETSNEITITVSGVVGAGKSTILDIIDVALRTRGITADVKGEDVDFYNRGKHTDEKLGILRQRGLTVTLEHKQLPRQPK